MSTQFNKPDDEVVLDHVYTEILKDENHRLKAKLAEANRQLGNLRDANRTLASSLNCIKDDYIRSRRVVIDQSNTIHHLGSRIDELTYERDDASAKALRMERELADTNLAFARSVMRNSTRSAPYCDATHHGVPHYELAIVVKKRKTSAIDA